MTKFKISLSLLSVNVLLFVNKKLYEEKKSLNKCIFEFIQLRII